MVNLNKELGNEGHAQKNWPSHSLETVVHISGLNETVFDKENLPSARTESKLKDLVGKRNNQNN